MRNLGWLLRNWKQVERFTVTSGVHEDCALNEDLRRACGCSSFDNVLVAHLRDGGRYVTNFASLDVLRGWLHRPVFRGLPVNFCGQETVC